jgi:hypothetical protein
MSHRCVVVEFRLESDGIEVEQSRQEREREREREL